MSFLPVYGKKLVAFLILGMSLFIQAEKLLHRHNGNTTCKHEQVQSLKSSNSGCSICEFQVSRDAQLADLEIPQLVPVVVSNATAVTSSDYHYLLYSFFPARGPPALVL